LGSTAPARTPTGQNESAGAKSADRDHYLKLIAGFNLFPLCNLLASGRI
jgi:hypothetical protein